MTFKTTSILGVVTLALLGGCSSLDVAKMPRDPKAGAEGIPYYPPRQDFVISELGFDENGKPTPNITLKVDLVSRPDTENGYLIRNSPGPFASTEFSVTRDTQGRLLTVSGKVEDKTLETVTALASVVVKAAAFAGVEAPLKPAKTLEELQKELDAARIRKATLESEIEDLRKALKQKPDDKDLPLQIRDKSEELKKVGQLIKRNPLEQEFLVVNSARLQTLKTLEKLGFTVPVDGKALKQAQENLLALNDRLAAIESGFAAATSPKGVTKSGYRTPKIMLAKDAREAQQLAAGLDPDQIGVILVPKQ